jgi:hypothetical protein
MGSTLHNDTCGIVTIREHRPSEIFSSKKWGRRYITIPAVSLQYGNIGHLKLPAVSLQYGNIGHLKFFLRKNGPTLHNDTCGIVTICKSFAFLYHYILLFILVKEIMKKKASRRIFHSRNASLYMRFYQKSLEFFKIL